MKNITSHLLVFVGGISTGVVLGVLFAPDTGRNTRDKLSYQYDKYKDKLRAMVTQLESQNKNTQETYSEVSRHDYKKAEELLREVEAYLDDLKKPQA